MRRIRGDLLDSLDEEFEMEFEDREYGGEVRKRMIAIKRSVNAALIFASCFGCRANSLSCGLDCARPAQGRDPVQGRDAAGEDCVIKRICDRQALHLDIR